MSEKRKPKYTILLKNNGNNRTAKLELFPASLWTDYYKNSDMQGRDRFRLRTNGKWWPRGEKKFLTKTQVKELLFQHIKS